MATNLNGILGLNFGSNPIESSIGNFAAKLLPQNMWSGTPIRNLLGIQPAYAATGSSPAPTQQVKAASTGNTTVFGPQNPGTGGTGGTGGAAPSTGGQGAGGGNNGGNTGPSTDDQYISALRNAYGESANALQSQGPALDNAYNQSVNDINTQIDNQQKAADTQKAQNAQTFGDILRQNAQTYNELGQKQRGTYSALGTLDSSAFQDDQQKAAQDLADNQSKTQNQQAVQANTIDNALTGFRQQAMSKLADLGVQYQQGKSAIAQALANNDLSSANAIQNALAGIRAQAQNVQNSILNFGLQAGVMAGYGKDATSAIQGATGSQFVQSLLQALQGVQNQGGSRYVLPGASGLSGQQGYIGSGNKTPINPFTGQPVSQ